MNLEMLLRCERKVRLVGSQGASVGLFSLFKPIPFSGSTALGSAWTTFLDSKAFGG